MNPIVLPIHQDGWDLVGADGRPLLGGIFDGPEARAEAEKIVIAVNAHDALVEALENLLKVHEGVGGTRYHAGDIAREALKLAKGE